jgi:ParB family chromosome partitioning protein
MLSSKLRYDEVPLDDIEISPFNVRKDVSEEGVAELADSIAQIGLQQPVVVYRAGGRYQLLIGQRRFLAFKRLRSLKLLPDPRIPALIVDVKDETDATIKSFSENVHRLDLEYREKMDVAATLLAELGSPKKVAQAVGVREQTVRNWLGYRAVPDDLKQMVDEGKISARTATRIARSVGDEDKAREVAQMVVEEPARDRRSVIIEVAAQNPQRSPAEILKIAGDEKLLKVTLYLTQRLADALDEACTDLDASRPQVATTALEEWLGNWGFLGRVS